MPIAQARWPESVRGIGSAPGDSAIAIECDGAKNQAIASYSGKVRNSGNSFASVIFSKMPAACS